jgi:hypothetical protein
VAIFATIQLHKNATIALMVPRRLSATTAINYAVMYAIIQPLKIAS